MPKFVPRQRKHKVLARQSQSSTISTTQNTNQDVILPASQAEKEAKRRQLRDELRSQQISISSKKQKRLDKYIENKLRKDETTDYLRKLEHERMKFDVRDADGLQSSKDLNKGVKGKKRKFNDFVKSQSEDDLGGKQPAIKNKVKQPEKPLDASLDDDIDSEDSFEADHKDAFDAAKTPELDTDEKWLTKRLPAQQGVGLAKPLELDANGHPMIPMKNKKRRIPIDIGPDNGSGTEDIGNTLDDTTRRRYTELPWEGFDSESDAHTGSEGENVEDDVSGSDDADFSSDDHDSESDSSATTDQSDADDSDQPGKAKIRTRTSAFKTWATQQLNQAVGHTPSYAADGAGELLPAVEKATAVHKQENTSTSKLVNGLPELSGPKPDRIIRSTQVDRSDSIQQARSQLPILRREQEIMESIHTNSVVIIKGDTGSGKTTQLPQFLYEAGYGDPTGPTPGLIGITQPRRVAAVSMAKRVSEEMGNHGSRVSHQIRFESTVSAHTAVKFMTDGILLRELSQDLLLKKYSAIIIDEAHERSVNTDILIGILSRVVPARQRKDQFNPNPKPLKLIIMSATLNIEDFLHDKLFPASIRPPIVEAEGRQHRVTTHFARKSRGDYVEEVVEKVKRAHHKLPRGGILVFLTGQNEIRQAQSELSKVLAGSGDKLSYSQKHLRLHAAASDIPLEVDDIDFGNNDRSQAPDDEETEIEIYTQSDEEAEDKEFEISDDEEEDPEYNKTPGSMLGQSQRLRNKDPYDSVHILPLYSQLPTKEQLKVFDAPPDRSRLIVLSTNVAETSLTIPGIRYVFDCGRSKERKYNLETGVQSFEIDYISKASAQQRAGRAGRTGPGHCWRLYSSAVYERYFPDHAEPEILRAPAESVVLQIKGFAYPRPVVEFPFPTPPTLQSLSKAEKLLYNLGALDPAGIVTAEGKELANYPLSPRLGKILSLAIQDPKSLAQIVALVAGLAVSEIFLNDVNAARQSTSDDHYDKYDQDARKQAYGRAQATLSRYDKQSDVMKLLTAVSMYTDTDDKDSFCEQYCLRPKAMTEVSQLLRQLKNIVQANHAGIQIAATTKDVKLWKAAQIKMINHIAAAGYIDQVAIRWDCAPVPPVLSSEPRRALDVPYLPLIPLNKSTSADLNEKAIFIHPSSVLARSSVNDCPQYIVYTHLQQAQARIVGGDDLPKTRMFPLTPIDAVSLSQLARGSALLQYGKPVPKTKIEDLPGIPKKRTCWVSTELRGGGAGSHSWNLPPTKVRQVLDVKSASGWRVEEILT